MKRSSNTARLISPAALLACGVVLSCALSVLPGSWTTALKSQAASLLRPGQRVAILLRDCAGRAAAWVGSHWQTAARLAEAEVELGQLRRENMELAVQRDALSTQLLAATNANSGDSPLLRPSSLPARLLGSQARAYLARHKLLDMGTADGIEPDALVFTARPLVDRGSDADVQTGQLVVSGCRVLGKIADAGPHTSTVRALTEPGYRDLVRIGTPDGPQGILEGTGGPLAGIRLVEVTEPVAEGDPVYSAAGEGVLDVPPLCGRVARLERPVGAAHWKIWVEPAVVSERIDRVAVLRLEPDPQRLAHRNKTLPCPSGR
jgi:hypothetical protein